MIMNISTTASAVARWQASRILRVISDASGRMGVQAGPERTDRLHPPQGTCSDLPQTRRGSVDDRVSTPDTPQPDHAEARCSEWDAAAIPTQQAPCPECGAP